MSSLRALLCFCCPVPSQPCSHTLLGRTRPPLQVYDLARAERDEQGGAGGSGSGGSGSGSGLASPTS